MTPRMQLLALPLLVVLAGCARENPIQPQSERAASTALSSARTFVLASTTDDRLPAPLAEAEGLAEVEQASGATAAVASPNSVAGATDPAVYWNRWTGDLGRAAGLPPPRFARAYALVQVGIYDAMLAARDVRRGSLPDAAVAAGVASEVLPYLFPSAAQQIEAEAAAQAGSRGRGTGEIQRAWHLGRAVGRLVVEYARADRSDTPFTGTIPTGDGMWTGTNPVLPMCGEWRTWILSSGSEFQPEPPYAYGSPDDLREVQEVYEASLQRTPEQIAIVHKWADRPPPLIWNGILNERIEAGRLTGLAAAWAHAYLNAAIHDAFVACWACKYVHWTARPFQRIPGLVTVIPTPNFPSYTSGHSTISGAAAVVLGELIPEEQAYFAGEADEAALSRFYGGIHFHRDDNQGLAVGRRIGAKVVAVMQADGGELLARR